MSEIEEKVTDLLTLKKLEPSEDNKSDLTRQFLAQQIKVCRVGKCWNPEFAKIELSAKADSLTAKAVDSIFRVLETHAKGAERPNQAPRGSLERQIQAWVNKQMSKKSSAAEVEMGGDEEDSEDDM